MRERVRHAFRRFQQLLPAERGDIRLMGTSGTVTTLASVYLALPAYDRKQIDGLMVPAEAMREISRLLSAASHEERAHSPASVTTAPIWWWRAARSWKRSWISGLAETLGIADRGIREGICEA
jgi:exopolyphosphatase/guanosine-5'-triphosphate,3'-diphosphate pyrophosphatase